MKGRVVKWYVYTNVKGEPRIRKRRWDPKNFDMQSSYQWPDGSWHWRSCISDERYGFSTLALYKLPELTAALRVDVPVWWCEGEKDAETLLGLGLTATTTPNSSELWHDQARWFTRYRTRSDVMVICDNDLHGGWWGWERYTALLRVGVVPERIHVVAPRLGFKDITDHVEAGRSPSAMRSVDLGRLEKAAHRYGASRAARFTSAPPPRPNGDVREPRPHTRGSLLREGRSK